MFINGANLWRWQCYLSSIKNDGVESVKFPRNYCWFSFQVIAYKSAWWGRAKLKASD